MVSFVPVSPIIRAGDLQSHHDDDDDKNNNRNSRTIIIRGGCRRIIVRWLSSSLLYRRIITRETQRVMYNERFERGTGLLEGGGGGRGRRRRGWLGIFRLARRVEIAAAQMLINKLLNLFNTSVIYI